MRLCHLANLCFPFYLPSAQSRILTSASFCSRWGKHDLANYTQIVLNVCLSALQWRILKTFQDTPDTGSAILWWSCHVGARVCATVTGQCAAPSPREQGSAVSLGFCPFLKHQYNPNKQKKLLNIHERDTKYLKHKYIFDAAGTIGLIL